MVCKYAEHVIILFWLAAYNKHSLYSGKDRQEQFPRINNLSPSDFWLSAKFFSTCLVYDCESKENFIFDQESIETLFQAPHAQLHERFISQTILNSLESSISWLGQMQCLQQTPLLSLSLEVYFLSVFHVSAQKNITNIILTGAKYLSEVSNPYSCITWSLWPPCWLVFSQGGFSCLTLLWCN